MDTRARFDRFGLIGVIVGFLALAAAVLPLWVLPVIFPPKPIERSVVETARDLRDRAIAVARGTAQPAPRAETQIDHWYRILATFAVVLALAAIALAVVSFLRREDWRYAGTAAALGVGAVAFEFWVIALIVAATLFFMYVVLRGLNLGF